MHRSRKSLAGTKPFDDFSIQIVPPVITIKTRASGAVRLVNARSSSGESLIHCQNIPLINKKGPTWNGVGHLVLADGAISCKGVPNLGDHFLK